MFEISVGAASACIAAGIALLQFIIPNALALVLAGNLSDTHSAVTWSVVSRFILSSTWPIFLSSESASSRAVSPRIAVVTWLKPLTLLIAAIAAVVTPLGLHDGIYPASDLKEATFVYAADRGPIGSGTPARSTEYGFSRTCGDFACPRERQLGNISMVVSYDNNGTNQTVPYRIVSPEIAQSLIDLYESGVKDNPTLSSFFDVQFRQWDTTWNFYYENNASTLSPEWSMLSSAVLDNKVEVLEGIILDMVNGSIGFRNHSVPTGLQYGAEWQEDILFLEPESVCVNTNVTAWYYNYVPPTGTYFSSYYQQGLIDHGGFVNLNRTDPYPASNDGDNTNEYPFVDSQRNPMLYERAYYAAWTANVYSMQFLNLTQPGTNRSRISSELGQRFRVNNTFISYDNSQNQYVVRTNDLSDMVSPPANYTFENPSEYNNYSSNPEIPNPWNVSSDLFAAASRYMGTNYGGDPVNITEIAVQIGMVGAPARRIDKGFEDSTDYKAPNSTWERPLFVCAGATRAKIRTVTFRYNSTVDNSLAALAIAAITDKEYGDAPLPIWGFETPVPRYNISSINPLWGFINPAEKHTANLTTLQTPSFWVPASSQSATGLSSDPSYISGDNVPLILAPPSLWGSTMYSSSLTSLYTGKNDLRLSLALAELSKNTTGIEKMLRLIWSDMAANLLVGTKGHHTAPFRQPVDYAANSKRQAAALPPTQVTFKVHDLQHHIRYHWIYAIPALICVSLVALILFLAFVFMVCGRGTISQLREYLYAVTSGRVMAAFIYQDAGGLQYREADTKTWIEEVGHKPVQIRDPAQGSRGQMTGVDDATSPDMRSKAQYVSVKQREDGDADS